MKNKVLKIISLSSLGAMVVSIGAAFAVRESKKAIQKIKASTYSMVLDNSNSPTLVAGTGTMVDDKQVTWEYSGAQNFATGHVSLQHEGYMGITSTSSWGITGIESIVVDYTATTGELWLLKSIDGNTWYEGEILTDDVESTAVNGWRFIRLFNYDESDNTVDINSVTINYSCSGATSSDDVDLTSDIDIVHAVSTNLSASAETDHFCGNNSTRAIRLTNTSATTYGTSHDAKISLGKTYTFDELKYQVLEFDYYHTEKGGNGSGYPQIKPLKNYGDISDSVTVTSGNYPSCYTDFDANWWHISIPFSAMLPTAEDSQQVNSIRIYDYNIYKTAQDIGGFVVIDNLRITSGQPSVAFESDSVVVDINDTHTLKPIIIGSPRGASFVSNDTDIVTVDNNGVLTPVAAGTTSVTANYCIGYNRQHIATNITVKVVDPSSLYSTGNLATISTVTVLNSAPITIQAVNNEHYGSGIKLTFTGTGTASQYVLRFDLPANVKIKGDNQSAKFNMTAKYGITTGGYYYTNGQRYRLTSGSTRVSNDAVQASNFSPTASGNSDDFYHYSCDVSAFGISSGAKDTSTFDSLELMIRPAAAINDTMEFYGVEFSNIVDYTLK